jgi:cyclophilin family peptidyl-prolyl cis-trans isomerase
MNSNFRLVRRFDFVISKWRCLVATAVAALALVGLIATAGMGQIDAAQANQDTGQDETSDAPAAEAYAAKLQAWKDLLTQLRDVKDRAATGGATDALRAEWNALIERANALLPELRDAAIQAYEEAPDADRQLTRFLVSMLSDDVARDEYDQAQPLAQVLVDHECGVGQTYRLAGVTAFALHDFEPAKALLDKAKTLDLLSRTESDYLDSSEDYVKFWNEEHQLREKDAEANLPRVRLTTNKGDIVLELFEDQAPQTVGNFVSLVEQGFYDDVTFHRVLAGFMAQGGCPEGTGLGGPGYRIFGEADRDDARHHFRGSLSMAHSGDPDSGGSQFFITFIPRPTLNGKHTVFGRVIEGMDVLAKLRRRDPQALPPLPEPDKIVKAEVIRKRDHEYAPTKVNE